MERISTDFQNQNILLKLYIFLFCSLRCLVTLRFLFNIFIYYFVVDTRLNLDSFTACWLLNYARNLISRYYMAITKKSWILRNTWSTFKRRFSTFPHWIVNAIVGNQQILCTYTGNHLLQNMSSSCTYNVLFVVLTKVVKNGGQCIQCELLY